MNKEEILKAECDQRPHFEFAALKQGYKEMKETRIRENGNIKTVTTFEEEEPISELEEATKHSLFYLEIGGEDLTMRGEMPHFFRFDITSNSAKEALEKTKDYLDYLQAEVKAEQIKNEPTKTPIENLKGE